MAFTDLVLTTRAFDADSYLECPHVLVLYEVKHILPVERGLFPVDIQRATGGVSYFMRHLLLFKMKGPEVKVQKYYQQIVLQV